LYHKLLFFRQKRKKHGLEQRKQQTEQKCPPDGGNMETFNQIGCEQNDEGVYKQNKYSKSENSNGQCENNKNRLDKNSQ